MMDLSVVHLVVLYATKVGVVVVDQKLRLHFVSFLSLSYGQTIMGVYKHLARALDSEITEPVSVDSPDD